MHRIITAPLSIAMMTAAPYISAGVPDPDTDTDTDTEPVYRSIYVDFREMDGLYFELRHESEVHFTPDELIICYPNDNDVHLYLHDLSGWSYSTVNHKDMQIETPDIPTSAPSVSVTAATVTRTDTGITVSSPGVAHVTMRTLSGITVADTSTAAGSVTIDTTVMPPGAYLLTIDGKTSKILIR